MISILPKLNSIWLTRLAVTVLILLLILTAYGLREVKFNRELNYARIAYNIGDYIGAQESNNLALDIHNLPEIRGELRRTSDIILAIQEGDFYFKTGDYAIASTYYLKVQNCVPTDKKIADKLAVCNKLAWLTNEAQLAQEQGNLAVTLARYQSIAKLDPNNISAIEKATKLSASQSEEKLAHQIITYYNQLRPFLDYCYKPALSRMSTLIVSTSSTPMLPEVKFLKTKLSRSQAFSSLKLTPELVQINALLTESIKSSNQALALMETSLTKKTPFSSDIKLNLETSQLQLNQAITKLNELLIKHPIKGLELLKL